MKTVSKSFRLSPATIQKIEEWPGENFTQKFQNMVNTVFDQREALQQDLERMKCQRAKLLREIGDLQSVKNGLNRLRDSITRSYSSTLEVEKTARLLSDCTQQIARCDHD